MTIYRDCVGVLGVGCLTFAISGSVYWSLGLVGLVMLLIALRWPNSNKVRAYTFDYSNVMYFLQHPGASVKINGADVYFDRNLLSQLKMGLSDGA